MMSERLIAYIRTVLPAVWGTLVAWLVAQGLPAELAPAVDAAAVYVLMPLCSWAIYALARWLESDRAPRLLRWTARLLLGSTRQPTYPPPAAHRNGAYQITSLKP